MLTKNKPWKNIFAKKVKDKDLFIVGQVVFLRKVKKYLINNGSNYTYMGLSGESVQYEPGVNGYFFQIFCCDKEGNNGIGYLNPAIKFVVEQYRIFLKECNSFNPIVLINNILPSQKDMSFIISALTSHNELEFVDDFQQSIYDTLFKDGKLESVLNI